MFGILDRQMQDRWGDNNHRGIRFDGSFKGRARAPDDPATDLLLTELKSVGFRDHAGNRARASFMILSSSSSRVSRSKPMRC